MGLTAGVNVYDYSPNVWGWIDPLGLCEKKADFYVGPSGPDSTLSATGYRYMDSSYTKATMAKKEAPLSYFGFEKFDTGQETRDAFQIFYEPGNPASWSDGRLRGTFDTLQLFDPAGAPKVKVPIEAGGKGLLPEPITRYYPKYGKGGIAQLVPKTPMKVKFDEVALLPEK